MTARWLEIKVVVQPQEADDVRSIMARWAGTAVAVEEPASVNGADFAPTECRISAYLREGPELAVTRYQLLNALWLVGCSGARGAQSPVERWTDAEEWYSQWKQFYKPLRVGRILILPEWEESQPDGDALVVRLGPGQAFGTGLHVTTRQALLALQRLDCRGKRVLDLGTGSGILAIAAARLGAREVLAIDSDARAIKSATANVTGNSVQQAVRLSHGSLIGPGAPPISPAFDFLLANIVATVHCELARPILESVRAGGRIVLAGIVAERAPEVKSAFAALGARQVKRADEEGWTCLTLRKARAAA